MLRMIDRAAPLQRRSARVSGANASPTAPRSRNFLSSPALHALVAGSLARRTLKGQGQLIRDLQATVGNAAVRLMILQRKGGWPDASSKGRAWNDPSAKAVGKIWRIAIAGLKGGTKEAFKDDDSAHTTEAADHRAIVMIRDGFKPGEQVEVLLYFHGHTEASRGQYAGWRQRTFKETRKTKKAKLVSDDTVRDVALDQIEQQIEHSGHSQMIGILPQGGPQHQFGDIKADEYIKDVLERVNAEYPDKLKKVPSSWEIILSAHSGGGFEVNKIVSGSSKPAKLKAIILFDAEAMADDIKQRLQEDLKFLADPAHKGGANAYLASRPPVRAFAREKSKYGNMYGTLVDDTITEFTTALLSADQRKEMDALRARDACVALSATERSRLKELSRTKPTLASDRNELKKLRERAACKPLMTRERNRLDRLAKRDLQLQSVTSFLPKLRALYKINLLDPNTVGHEEIIRGTHADSGPYKAGQGTLEQALQSVP